MATDFKDHEGFPDRDSPFTQATDRTDIRDQMVSTTMAELEDAARMQIEGFLSKQRRLNFSCLGCRIPGGRQRTNQNRRVVDRHAHITVFGEKMQDHR
eukprot:4061508-Amphidinium_carterae.1